MGLFCVQALCVLTLSLICKISKLKKQIFFVVVALEEEENWFLSLFRNRVTVKGQANGSCVL